MAKLAPELPSIRAVAVPKPLSHLDKGFPETNKCICEQYEKCKADRRVGVG
jgi:hypothetical protein